MFLFIILITLFILFILWLYNESYADLKVSDLKIKKKKFVCLVLQWCSTNLGSIKYPYQLKLYYSISQK